MTIVYLTTTGKGFLIKKLSITRAKLIICRILETNMSNPLSNDCLSCQQAVAPTASKSISSLTNPKVNIFD